MTVSNDPQSQAEKEIKEAAENISKNVSKDDKEKHFNFRKNDRSTKGLMWAGVALITLVVVGMWGWNMKTAIYDLQYQQSEGGEMLNETQQNLDSLLSNFEKIQTTNNTTNTTDSQKSLETSLDKILKNTSTTNSKSSTTTVTTTINSPNSNSTTTN